MSKKTKVTDLTQSVKVERKPIEFVMFLNPDGILTEMFLNPDGILTEIRCRPNEWDNLQRIAVGKNDTIMAWDDCLPNERVIYLGHWNDGYVDND
jgi:hypothetical protein